MTPRILPDTNNETLAAYEHDFDGYIQNTPNYYSISHVPLLNWIDYSLSLIPERGKVLELGSGLGRDAKYIQAKGYQIVCSDAVNVFIEYLRSESLKVKKLNIIKDTLPEGFDLILANAVIPHLNESEVELSMKKIFHALTTDGVFALSAKEGVGNTWTNEKLKKKRFVHYWNPDDLTALAESIGFKVAYKSTGRPGDLKNHRWTHLTLKK